MAETPKYATGILVIMINRFYRRKANRCLQERRKKVRKTNFPHPPVRQEVEEHGKIGTLGSQKSLHAGKNDKPDAIS